MFQRLLFTLSVCLITVALFSQDIMRSTDVATQYDSTALPGSTANPNVPGPGVFSKWVYDATQKVGRIPWDHSKFKCYIYGSTPYRLRFPNGYDQNSSTKYPLIIFLHGAGEAANKTHADNQYKVNGVTFFIDRENRDQLFWGAQDFQTRVDNGEWNGFMLFPQLWSDGTAWDANSTIQPLNPILDALEQYNHLDPSRVIVMGLSAGGRGTLQYSSYFPKRIATSITSCPPQMGDLTGNPALVDAITQIPFFFASGGEDGGFGGTDPAQAFTLRDMLTSRGGSFYESYFFSQPHGVWTSQWNLVDASNNYILSKFWNAAHKAQPVVYFQKTEFCPTETVSVKMGLTANFLAYEWQYDAGGGGGFGTIAGATANEYTATQVGRYRARYKRDVNTDWSDWSPQPIVITNNKKCALDTAFASYFEEDPAKFYSVFAGPGNAGPGSPFRFQNVQCQNGLLINSTEFISRGPDNEGSRFLFNATFNSIYSATMSNNLNPNSCPAYTYVVGDQIWRSDQFNVTPNTNYLLNFYMTNNNTSGANMSLKPTINDVQLAGSNAQVTGVWGDFGWKKFSYPWNSGGNGNAIIAFLSNISGAPSNTGGNEFALDNISLVKYKPTYAGGALQHTNLWVRADAIKGFANGVGFNLWNNQELSGNNLVQRWFQKEPFYGNNAVDNINFNPTGKFVVSAGRSYLGTPGGFAGTAAHTAAYVYMVLKNASTTQTSTLLRERVSGGTQRAVMVQVAGTQMSWTGGEDSSQVLKTSAGVGDTIPTVWTFSRNSNAGFQTPSGFGRDIRKNGVVVASGAASNSSFTGNNGDFTVAAALLNPLATDNFGIFNGNIAEIIFVLDSNITVKKQNNIESYLALKYGTTLGNISSPISYTASDSTTVYWTASNTYQNDVFGIGTDSLTGLVQAQSNSVNSGSGSGVGKPGKGNLVLSTPTDLADKQFLMIGNNGASLVQAVINSGEAPIIAVGSTRVGRAWRVQNTGLVGAVNLSFDTTGLSNQAGGADFHNYALMLDADGDGNFNTGTVTFLNATGGAGKLILFNNVTLPNNSVFSIITAKSSTLLPAVWLSFTAEEVNGNALLTWKTGDEMNVDKYIVEHSYNGVSFSGVGSVAAKNTSGTNTYTFLHTNLTQGTHYYRIRRVDLNGVTELSDTHSVKIAAQGANLVIRPNPVSGNMLTLSVNVAQNTRSAVQVLSMDGKMMSRNMVSLTAGSNLVNVDISFVPAGIYLLEVQLNDAVIVKKFIRQ